ncbi:hypothetical protein C1H46_020251 [Malus baccata]|uniref:Mitochondrial import inner membrane translocase subunit TIM50 n=1 Tax=Malus baccata TaxID=106549 RepID=A0A540M5S3_MALBA|nr:hypothetical protein C1H46_020251 [Malus baccata]
MADEKICNKKLQYDSDEVDDDDGHDDCNEDTGSDCGLSLEKIYIGSRKKLVIFSLNGLLVHRVIRYNRAKIPSNRTPDGTYGSYLVFRRPFCEEFMQFCFERFEVGIWSSAQVKNVDGVLDCVMGKAEKATVICLDPKGELGKYLDGLADAKDVQIYVKENPFGQPAVSSTHPHWKFYSNVLRRLRKQYER